MHNLNKLHIHQLARKNILAIHTITQQTTGFADIHNQMQRAALSVVSNIAEGAGMNTNKQFLRILAYARGSNTELKSQPLVMVDLGKISAEHKVLDQVDHLGAMCTRLMQRLQQLEI